MTIREMREVRTKLATSMRGILDIAEKENRDLTNEEQQSFDKLDADMRSMEKRIEREERTAAIEDELRKSANGDKKPEERTEDNGERAEYRKAFGEYLRSGAASQELRDAHGVVKGSSTYAGYLAPVALEKKLISEITAQNVMRRIADVRTSGTDVDIPIVTTHPSAALIGEGASITASTPVFNHKQLKAYKFAARTYITWEALEDMYLDYEQWLTDEFAPAFATAEETYFVTGSGAGSAQPEGVVTGAGSGITAASATAITADELLALIYSVGEKFRKNGALLMKDATVLACRKLKTGDGQYLWQPGLALGQPDRLLGYPVYTSDGMAGMQASAVPILFGDFKRYRIQDRAGIRIQRLNEVAADTGEVGFVAHHRTDGCLLVQDAVKKLTMHA